ncbi:MAG TPA: hypothetical protein VMT69_14385 [Kineosporiaceae bacterium]|nr:hypothetical protein [Kineosporiaceae bacterium]
MRFDVGPSRTVLAAGTDGARLPVTASIGTRDWAQFHVDAVADGIRMTGQPDPVLPLTDIAPGTDRQPWRAHPLVDSRAADSDTPHRTAVTRLAPGPQRLVHQAAWSPPGGASRPVA